MAKTTTKGISWAPFIFHDASNRFSISYNEEVNKWELYDGDKLVTRRKRITGLVGACNEYAALNAAKPAEKPTAKSKASKAAKPAAEAEE